MLRRKQDSLEKRHMGFPKESCLVEFLHRLNNQSIMGRQAERAQRTLNVTLHVCVRALTYCQGGNLILDPAVLISQLR